MQLTNFDGVVSSGKKLCADVQHPRVALFLLGPTSPTFSHPIASSSFHSVCLCLVWPVLTSGQQTLSFCVIF